MSQHLRFNFFFLCGFGCLRGRGWRAASRWLTHRLRCFRQDVVLWVSGEAIAVRASNCWSYLGVIQACIFIFDSPTPLGVDGFAEIVGGGILDVNCEHTSRAAAPEQWEKLVWMPGKQDITILKQSALVYVRIRRRIRYNGRCFDIRYGPYSHQHIHIRLWSLILHLRWKTSAYFVITQLIFPQLGLRTYTLRCSICTYIYLLLYSTRLTSSRTFVSLIRTTHHFWKCTY